MKQILSDGLTFAFSFLSTSVFHAQCLLSCPFYFCLSSFASLSLPSMLSVSLLQTRDLFSSHCIYSPVAPSRPRPRCDWMADADDPAQYATLPILLTDPSGNRSVTAEIILTPTYGQIIHPNTNMQAGTHKLREKDKAFTEASVFPFIPSSILLQTWKIKILKIRITGLYLIINFDDRLHVMTR